MAFQVNVAELVDEEIARGLWESLPADCRQDHFDLENLPDRYRESLVNFITPSSGRSRRSPAISLRELPEPMTWELAWLLH